MYILQLSKHYRFSSEFFTQASWIRPTLTDKLVGWMKELSQPLNTCLANCQEELAPQLSLQEEFVGHWKAVTAFFIDNKGEKMPVEQTSIPAHLEQMLVLLQQEDLEVEGGMYGPCLEYLLQHKLLETLYSLGRTDYPPGMKQMVLSFFIKLLSKVKKPILAHVNVYRAVQRMIKTCGEVKAGPTEIEEIQFLCTVCAKIKADPYLVNFFLEMPKQSSQPSVSNSNVPGVPVQEEPVSENKLQQEFYLVTTLLNLSHSEDSRVAVKACEGLILCSSLPEPIAAHCMINSTCFCDDLTQRLIDTYIKLPESINPVDLEFVQAKWGMDVITEREDKQTFAGKRHLVSFLSWLDFCDQLSTIANPIVAEALARNIHQKFLLPYFKPALLQMSESGAITSMAYLTRCLRTVCSQRLLSEFALFVIGDERKPEQKESDTNSGCLRSRLIERCNNVSEDMCLVALQLFDTLLQKDDEHILHNLVIRNLEGRHYCKTKSEACDNKNTQPSKKESEMISEFKTLTSSDVSILNESQNEQETESIDNCDTQNEAVTQNEALSQNEAESQSELFTQNTQNTVNEDVSQNGYSSNEHNEDISKIISKENTSQHKEGEDINEEILQSNTLNSNNNQTEESLSQLDSVMIEDEQTTNPKSIFSGINSLDSSPTTRLHFSPVYSKTEVHKIVNSFLSLLPEDLKSSYQTADSGYDMYLRDAHRQYTSMLEVTKTWGYPLEVEPLPTHDESFYEGSFLHMLLDKLTHILDQSYPVNLQLTSVISKLALVPHPCLHEYLLDPFLPVKPGVRTLYNIFQKVSSDIKSKFEAESDLSHKSILVRKKLMGNSTSGKRFEGQNELEAIIVLEEFCKELSAIAFVKHHAAVTGERDG